MVRTVEKKYQIWLAGYYDDFNGARAIADDLNQPSDASYSISNSHFGNPMNGEAFLNPKYRFSLEDRVIHSGLTSNTKVASSSNYELKNDGIFEWLSFDDTRIDNYNWAGRAQLQYPDGHVANRYAFNNDTSTYDTQYHRFINGHNSDASYLVPVGDNDASFGRKNMEDYDNTNYANKEAGLIDTTGDFVQRAHLAGVWTGEQLQQISGNTTPLTLYAEVKSPSGMPFLCVQSSRKAESDSATTPTIIYDGPLNTRLDGDIFTARIAVRTMKAENAAWDDTRVLFEIGFPASEAGILNDGGYTGTPAIYYNLDLSAISYDEEGLLYNSSGVLQSYTNDDAWIDVDFVFNYTTNKFDVYVNGTSHATNQPMTDGNLDGTSDSATTASNLYGYQITVNNATNTDDEGWVSYLMLDRVGLVRYLTDDITSSDAHITHLELRQPTNGISSCVVQVADDPDLTGGVRGAVATDYVLNLQSLFVATAPLDWSLLFFGDTDQRIDRPLWRGFVDRFTIKQKHRNRVLTISAKDSIEKLNNQIPLWDIGQKNKDSSGEPTDYWGYDAQGFRDIMNLGGGKLKLLDNNIGFDTENSYIETADQRMQLGSGHAIQLYNNEDDYGPNNVENDYVAFNILGFTEPTGSATTVIAIPNNASHGKVVGDFANVHITADNYATTSTISATAVDGTTGEITFNASDLAYSNFSQSSKIFYIGKYPGLDSALASYWENITTDSITEEAWNRIYNNGPSSTHPTGTAPFYTNIFFETDPQLKVGDYFYINRRNDAASGDLSSAYRIRHRVTRIRKMRSYLSVNAGSGPNSAGYFWAVQTNTPYSGSESHGTYTSDSFLTGTARFSWSKDAAYIEGVFDSDTASDIKYRALHSKWMRDLPMSLWFQYNFGKIKYDYTNNTLPSGVTRVNYSKPVAVGGVSLSPTTKSIKIEQKTYENFPNSGIVEIWAVDPPAGLGLFWDSTRAIYLEKFIYQGKQQVSSDYYLTGVKYIQGTYPTDNTTANRQYYFRVQDIDNDYKHIWLLWSDMRNNGKANADGSERKTSFGLQYPIDENYTFDLYFADQTDAEGNLDNFGALRNGEDFLVWNMDATSDPFTGTPLSKPADYTSPNTATLDNNGGKLRITVSDSSGFGTYVHLVGSTAHDGIHEITSNTSNQMTTTTDFSATTGHDGGIIAYPAGGSEAERVDIFHDWENKAGSLIVIDCAKFFNLNTHANNGRTGQIGGGRTDLSDYVAEREGFPALIDNYWAESITSYSTTGSILRQHQNQNHLISDVTTATNGFPLGSIGLAIDDTTNFAESGVGRLITVYDREDNSPNNNDRFFVWDGKLDSIYVSSSGIDTPIGTDTVDGVAVYTLQNLGETYEDSGIKKGMVLERTPTGGGDVTYHNILEVTNNTTIKVEQTTVDGTAQAWAVGDTIEIRPQLAMIFEIPIDQHLQSLVQSQLITETEIEVRDRFLTTAGGWASYGHKGNYTAGTNDPIAYEVHATVASSFLLRFLLHVNGYYKSKTGGGYWNSDKMRLLWNAAIMDTWLPSTTVNCIFDINNVPITSHMTTYNDTSSNDYYGSITDSRGKTLGATLREIQEKASQGESNYTTFTYRIGRDNRIELRPKYNSGITLNRNNMKISDIDINLSSQIQNIRVYYNNGKSFADYPSASLGDSTRWKIIEKPSIVSSEEAKRIAEQEYNTRKNNSMQLKVEPILESDTQHKMIETGRYGYIADPYIALNGNADNTASKADMRVCNWTVLGTGGALFPGMVNALNGNMNTDITSLSSRYGSSKNTNASGTVEWVSNFYWYGSNSISHAVQIVHIPNGTPLTNSNGHSMRMTVDLKNQTGTSIDDAEFVVKIADYNYTNNRDRILSSPSSSMVSTKDVKHSGFYEIDIPTTYGASAGAKIVFSFNAEYCRALLRHRCGDPTQTNNGLSNYILDSSVDNGSGSVNDSSIFPLGLRVYSEMGGGFRDERKWWYAPRVHICRDFSYVPASYVSVTDAGLELNAETMSIKQLSYNVKAGITENVILTLERDEGLERQGILTYLFSPTDSNSLGSVLGTDPLIDDEKPLTPNDNKPDEAWNPENDGEGDQHQDGEDGFTPSQHYLDKILRQHRMDLPLDNFSGNGRLAIPGQKKVSTVVPYSSRGIEGMNDDIAAVAGTAAVSNEGYIFAARGLMAGDAAADSQETTIETTFTIPIDVLNEKIHIEGDITHGPDALNNTTAVLYTTARTASGNSVTHTTTISTGLDKSPVTLLPTTSLKGANVAGEKITVTITRKAGTGDDDSDTSSVVINNLNINMDRASAHTQSGTSKFRPY
jgi:hypothetical protein